MVTWREVIPSDAAAVVLLDQYFTTRALDFPAGAEAYRRSEPLDADFTAPRGVMLVVEYENLGGEPADVGIGGVRRISDGTLGPRFELKHLWVQPHARRLGLGRSLVLELQRRAREFGALELVLDTHVAQREAGALYRSLGFEPVAPFNDNPNANTWLGRTLDDDSETTRPG